MFPGARALVRVRACVGQIPRNRTVNGCIERISPFSQGWLAQLPGATLQPNTCLTNTLRCMAL